MDRSLPPVQPKQMRSLDDTLLPDEVRLENARLRSQLATLQAKLTSYQEAVQVRAALEQQAIVTITDENGIIGYVNDTFCRLTGYQREEVLGRTHRVLNSAHHAADLFVSLYRTIRNGAVWRGQIRNRAKDGSFF